MRLCPARRRIGVERTTPEQAGSVAVGAGDDRGETGDPATLSSGEFISLEHTTSGAASVVELDDGSRFLRIENLDTSSGPDLRVYLSQAPADGTEDALDDAFRRPRWSQGEPWRPDYEIPAGVDLEDFQSIAIWCRRFSAGFGVAPLGS